MAEKLTDEQAALIWAGETSSLQGMTENVEVSNVTEESSEIENSEVVKPKINEDEITNIFAEVEEDEDEEEVEVEEQTVETTPTTTVKPKGRKPVELVTLVNQLIEDNILEPFEDSEVKTIEDAKELIKSNLEARESVSEDKWWENKINKYSPQIQAILHYAENGGTDVAPLLSAISKIEEVIDLDPSTDAGMEEIVRQTLKIKGFDDEEIADQISTFKDLDKLKAKAEKFLPELKNLQQKQVTMLMQEQEQRQEEARKATDIYISTIKDTLDKEIVGGIKLQREDKAKIYEALAFPNKTSLNGVPTNGFVKALENLQFGKDQDYEHFANIVLFAIDKEAFLEKIKVTIKNEVQTDTAKKLRSSKTTTANTEQNFESKQLPKKTGINRDSFKNPFG